MRNIRLIFGTLILMSGALFVLLLIATGTSPNIFSGEIAYSGQPNAISSGEIAYIGQRNAISTGEIAFIGQRNAISTGEIPTIGLISSQISTGSSYKSLSEMGRTKPQNATASQNMTNQSMKITMPVNMTNQSLSLPLPQNLTNSTTTVGNATTLG